MEKEKTKTPAGIIWIAILDFIVGFVIVGILLLIYTLSNALFASPGPGLGKFLFFPVIIGILLIGTGISILLRKKIFRTVQIVVSIILLGVSGWFVIASIASPHGEEKFWILPGLCIALINAFIIVYLTLNKKAKDHFEIL